MVKAVSKAAKAVRPDIYIMAGSLVYGGYKDYSTYQDYLKELLDEGVYNGKRYLKPETVRYFTSAPFATSNSNRRGIGFDKLPLEKKGSCTASKSGSMRGYGHTGFTGTFVWTDPANNTVIVFLSNRVYPNAEPNKLVKSGIRSILHDILYEAYPIQ
jgi:CubicO group peptidase (beta-lactamase class C family)